MWKESHYNFCHKQWKKAFWLDETKIKFSGYIWREADKAHHLKHSIPTVKSSPWCGDVFFLLFFFNNRSELNMELKLILWWRFNFHQESNSEHTELHWKGLDQNVCMSQSKSTSESVPRILN